MTLVTAGNAAPTPRAADAPSGPVPLSLESLYSAEMDYVWHSLRRLGVPSAWLPDVTHDVFVVVHNRLHTFDASRPVRPWLFGIAFRVASDHRSRRANRTASQGEAPDPVDPEDSAEEQLNHAQTRALVHEALQHVELDRRAVLILHDIEEQPVSEIAVALGVPAKTLYSRLRIAREEFTAAVRRIRLRRGER